MAKPKTPEEIMKEIEKLKKDYEKAEVELKEARRASVTEAVRKAGADFEEVFKVYLNKRRSAAAKQEQIDKLRTELSADTQYLKEQYKNMRDTLVGAGAKEEFLPDVIGEPPAVKAAKAEGTTGGTKKRTKAKLADGTTLSWSELLEKHKIPHKDGNSAHREWDAAVAANANLPKVEVVTVE